MEINERSVSKSQQRLMGAAYAYAKGDLEDAPDVVKNVAKSFMKKGKKKGKKSLRDFAKTKHKKLPNRIGESLKYLKSFDNF